MPHHIIKQRGFSVVEGIVIILVVVVIAGVGSLVYVHYHKASKPKSTSDIVSSSQVKQATVVPKKDSTSTSASQATTVSTTTTVSVPELNIEITVPNAIKDLIYRTLPVTLVGGSTGTLAYFSTSSLTSADANCGPSSAPLGTLQEVSGQYPNNNPNAQMQFGRLVKQFSTFYISGSTPSAGCSTNATAQATAGTDRSDFQSSLSTIQQLN